MAPLLSRLFINKKRHFKSNIQDFIVESKSSNTPLFNGENQVRMVLFRESDCRSRKLLFDSKSTKKKSPEKTSKSSPTRIANLIRLTASLRCPQEASAKSEEDNKSSLFEFLKPSPDVKMLGEMIFGSVAMTYRGTTMKVHTIRSPPQLMISIIFPAPVPECANVDFRRKGLEVSGSSTSRNSYISKSLEKDSLGVSHSLSVDVPFSQQSALRTSGSLHSTVSTSSLLNHAVSVDSTTSSLTHSSSYSNLHRRWMKNMSTSIEYGLYNRFLTTEEGRVPSQRKMKLGLCVLISFCKSETQQFEEFFFTHITIIESYIRKLQDEIEKACLQRTNFIPMIYEAYCNLKKSIQDLYVAPRLHSPVWLSLTSSSNYHHQCSRFIVEFASLLEEYDTKQTNFFVTSLLTAVLTYHISWVPTIIPPTFLTRHNYKKRSAEWVDWISKSHPYNVLSMQMEDLYGALGYPSILSKTIVVGKKVDVLLRFLYILSYFIRCSEVMSTDLKMIYSTEDILPDMSFLSKPSKEIKDKFSYDSKTTSSPAQLLVEHWCSQQSKLERTQTNKKVGHSPIETPSSKSVFVNSEASKSQTCFLKDSSPGFSLSEHNKDVLFTLGDSPLSKHDQLVNRTKESSFDEDSSSCSSLKEKLINWKLHEGDNVNISKPKYENKFVPSIELCLDESHLQDTAAKNISRSFETLKHKIISSSWSDNVEGSKFSDQDSQLNSAVSERPSISPLPPCEENEILFQVPECHLQDAHKRNAKEFTLQDKNPDSSQESIQTLKGDVEETPKHAKTSPCGMKLADMLEAEDTDIPLGTTEVPLLGISSEQQISHTRFKNLGHSLMAGITDHYMKDFCLQGLLGALVEQDIQKELCSAAEFSVLGEPVSDAVCIVADTESWKVKLITTNWAEDKMECTSVVMSPLVSNICDSLLQICHLHMSSEFCLMHLEDKLQELYFRSVLLTDLLNGDKTQENLERAMETLKLEADDIPLLLAVASTQVTS